MAQANVPTVCEVEGENCKKEVQALCYHCSKNLCRTHLLRHAQLIEERIQSDLHALADTLNVTLSRFNELSFSDDILKEPFEQLEKFRADVHKQVDDLVDIKRQELNNKLRLYRETLQTNNEEQLLKLQSCKKLLADLIQEGDASSSQIKNLQQSIDVADKYINNVKKPVMNVVPRTFNLSVDIVSQLLEDNKSTADMVREFRIIYIRLNGIVRNYYVKANKNGKMSDLINNFVQQYTTVEELAQRQTNHINVNDHLPKTGFILPVEIYNHRIHLQYNDNSPLANILFKDIIAFYETPHSLQLSACSPILMPCLFQNIINQQKLGLPIYISVPRNECRGQDVRDAIDNSIGNFYCSNNDSGQFSYETDVKLYLKYQVTWKKLDTILNDHFDFTKTNMILMVKFDPEFVDKYERKCLDEFKF